ACSEEESQDVIEKSAKALNPEGRIIVQEFYMKENRTLPFQSALFTINMLVNTPAGRCYSPSEIKGWLSLSGFRRIREKITEDTVLVIGEKVA
ncbi:MAG TPA: methyltransferase, partial [Thermodesulfovibrionales bacterium]|nr:methyltransferase [Thermodesulfovibrionales bacterium]